MKIKFKKGSKIHIKDSQKGSFTKYCNGKVTEECIQKGKNSSDPKIRKKLLLLTMQGTSNIVLAEVQQKHLN